MIRYDVIYNECNVCCKFCIVSKIKSRPYPFPRVISKIVGEVLRVLEQDRKAKTKRSDIVKFRLSIFLYNMIKSYYETLTLILTLHMNLYNSYVIFPLDYT